MAEGILRIAVVSMAGAIKEVSVMRGIDPRDFALLPYGGAGPLQAVAIAEELGMRTVVVPPMPGNFSAFGLLVADFRRDLVRTRVSALGALAAADMRALLAELADAGRDELEAAGFPEERRRFTASLDMRYAGQSFELSVPAALDIDDLGALARAFEDVYVARYGGTTTAPIEVVSYRVAAWGLSDKPELPAIEGAGRSLDAARIGTRDIVFGGTAQATPILDRDRLPVGEGVTGPVIIEEEGRRPWCRPAGRPRSTGSAASCCAEAKESCREHRSDHAGGPDPGPDLDRPRDAGDRLPHREFGRDL